MKCALRFQELQAVLALYNSERLYCGKTAGFGWDVNGYKDDCESVDTAAIQGIVLGMYEAELSEVLCEESSRKQ